MFRHSMSKCLDSATATKDTCNNQLKLIAKNKLASIQEKYLEEASEDVFADSNKEILDITRSIMKEIKEKDIDTFKLSKYCEDEARSEEIDKADAEPEEIG